MKLNDTALPFLFVLLAFVLASLLGAAAFAQPACVNGVYMAADTSAAAMDVDDDDDGLIEICNLDGLDHIRHNLAGTSYKASADAEEVKCGASSDTDCTGYELVKDLDFAGSKWGSGGSIAAGWPPIGGSTNGLTGAFEGSGHVIKNLYVHVSTFGKWAGLFARISPGGEVRNLGVEGVNVTGVTTAGGLAGVNAGLVNNCHSTGSVTVTSTVAGGLVGENANGDVTNCHSSVEVMAGAGTGGGLLGRHILGGTISNCYATGDVLMAQNSSGGLVGFATAGTISNCYATGDISGGGSRQGGLMGDLLGAAVTSCYATGAVSGTGNKRGALVGELNPTATVTSSYATGVVSGGGSDVGGLVGKSQGTVTSSYWENAGTAIDDAMDNTDRTAEELKSLPDPGEADLFDAWSTDDWNFGDDTQYPAVRTYAVNDSDEQVQGYVLCDQPMPRPECVPLVSIAAASSGVDEGDPAVFTLTRTRPPTAELTITVAVTGDTGFASAPLPTTATFAADKETTTLSIATGNDMDEEDGVITVTVSSTATYRVDKYAASAEVAVADDDLPEVSISGGDAVTEGETVMFTVTRVGVNTAALSVKVTVDDGAGDFLTDPLMVTEGTEMTELPLVSGSVTVTIAADQDSQTFTVSTVDDTTDEADGTLTATIIAEVDGPYRVDATDAAILRASVEVAVTDDDPILVRVTGAASAEGAAGAVFTLMRARVEAGALAVKVTVDDGVGDFLTDPLMVTEGTEMTELPLVSGSVTVTIAADQDSQTFTVSTVDDTTDEADGTLTATIIAEVDGPYRVHATDAAILRASVEVAVTDDDLPSITSFKIGENFGVIDENAVPNKTITVTVAEAERTLLVDVTPTVVAVRSDATVTPPGMVTFEDGTAQDFTVMAGDETVIYKVTVNVVAGTPPGVPGGFSAVAGVEQVTLSWTTPTELGSTGTLSRHEYQQTQGTAVSTWTAVVPPTALTQVVAPLMAGEVYGFEVRAVGSNGLAGDATAKQEATPLAVGALMFMDTIANQTYTEDTAITDLVLPVATGGMGPYTYTLDPVPAGLEFDADDTRILSGTPTMPTTTTHTYTVTDTTTLTVTLMFTITVNAAGTFGIGSKGAVVHVYPNPAGDVLHIEFSSAGDYGIALLTLTGKSVLGGWYAGGGTRKLDVSTLKGGVYFLKVEDSEGVSHTVRILR